MKNSHLEFAAGAQDDGADRLAEALRFPTVSHADLKGMPAQAFLGLHEFLEKKFPRVHAALEKGIINGFTLTYAWRGEDPTLDPILLLAHQDVVPADSGTAGEWSYPPFAGKIADGYIWGRGALDVKSSLMGILEAVEALLGEGFWPRRTVLLVFGHDEEVGGVQGAARAAERLGAENVRLEFVLDEGGSIVEGVVPGVAGPVALVGTAEKGYANVQLIARGEGGHSSMPPRRSAAGILGRALARLESRPFPLHLQYTRQLFRAIGSERMAFPLRILLKSPGLFRPVAGFFGGKFPKLNAAMRTTVAATMLRGGIKENVMPTSMSAVLNCRIIPGESVASVVRRIRRVICDSRVQVQLLEPAVEPSAISKVDSPWFEMLEKTIKQVSPEQDLAVAPYLVLGATDSRYFRGLSDHVYRFLFNRMTVSDLPRLHGIDERISLGNYRQIIRFYTLLLKNAQL
jgi:carboxypeptidase PM20D1